MSITRKEFFRQGFLSLSKTVFDVADTLRDGAGSAVSTVIPEPEQSCEARPDMVAAAFNERCLAKNCGCFACAERCEAGAVVVVPGEGVRIDTARCIGCGTCEYVCPVAPKAVILVPREKKV